MPQSSTRTQMGPRACPPMHALASPLHVLNAARALHAWRPMGGPGRSIRVGLDSEGRARAFAFMVLHALVLGSSPCTWGTRGLSGGRPRPARACIEPQCLTLSPRSIEFECPTHQVCLEPWIDVQKPAWRGTGGRRARQTRSSCARPSTPKLLVTAQTRHTRQRASRSGARRI